MCGGACLVSVADGLRVSCFVSAFFRQCHDRSASMELWSMGPPRHLGDVSWAPLGTQWAPHGHPMGTPGYATQTPPTPTAHQTPVHQPAHKPAHQSVHQNRNFFARANIIIKYRKASRGQTDTTKGDRVFGAHGPRSETGRITHGIPGSRAPRGPARDFGCYERRDLGSRAGYPKLRVVLVFSGRTGILDDPYSVPCVIGGIT